MYLPWYLWLCLWLWLLWKVWGHCLCSATFSAHKKTQQKLIPVWLAGAWKVWLVWLALDRAWLEICPIIHCTCRLWVSSSTKGPRMRSDNRDVLERQWPRVRDDISDVTKAKTHWFSFTFRPYLQIAAFYFQKTTVTLQLKEETEAMLLFIKRNWWCAK